MATLLTGGTGFSTTTSATQQKTFYERQLLEHLKNVLVYNQFGQKARIPRKGGKTIEWRRFEPLAVATTALTEGTAPAGKDLTFNKVEATVAQYGDFVRGSDLVDVTSIDPIITVATELLAQQAAETLDIVTREVLAAGTNVNWSKADDAVATAAFPTSNAGLKSGSGVRASLKFIDLVRARKTMFTNRAMPVSGNRFPTIITIEQWQDLMSDADIKQTWNYGGKDNLVTGELGSYMGLQFYETSLPSTIAAGVSSVPAGVTAQNAFCIGKQSYGTVSLDGMGLTTITKTTGSGGATGDPLDMIWSQGWKAVHQAKILNETWLLQLRSSVYV